MQISTKHCVHASRIGKLPKLLLITVAIIALMISVSVISCGDDPPDSGFIQITLESSSMPGLQALHARVTKIKVVHRTSLTAPETLITLSEREQMIPLAGLQSGVPRILGLYQVPIGWVTQIRFVTEDGTIRVYDQEEDIKIPSGPQTGIKVVPEDGKPFQVEASKTSRMHISFDPTDSVIENYGKGYILKPVVRGVSLPPITDRDRMVEDQFIVGFADSVDSTQIDAANTGFGATIIRPLVVNNTFLLQLPAGSTVEEAEAYYTPLSEVDFAIPNYVFTLRRMPNDLNDLQWSLHNTGQTGGTLGADIDALDAWDVTIGSTEVVLAVLDNGVDLTHPDLAYNIWINEGELPALLTQDSNGDGFKDGDFDRDGVITFYDLNNPDPAAVALVTAAGIYDNNGNGFIDGQDLIDLLSDGIDNDGNGWIDDLVGWDFDSGDNNPSPDGEYPHGTEVASVIGAQGDNGPVGPAAVIMTGINWRVRIMPVKVCLFMDCLMSSFEDGLTYTALNGAHGANISWGVTVTSGDLDQRLINWEQAFDRTGANVAGANLLISIATPNDKTINVDDADILDLPTEARRDNLITVTASNNRDSYTTFTSYGVTTVDLAAPGETIYMANVGGGVSINSGTSFAAPHVLGVGGLIFANDPTLRFQGDQVRLQIINTVDLIEDAGSKILSGGRLNAANALQ